MKVYIVEYIEDTFEIYEHFKPAYEFAKSIFPEIDSKTKVIKSIDKHEVYWKTKPEYDDTLRIYRKPVNRNP